MRRLRDPIAILAHMDNGMNLTDYDVVSFDCYGTLIDWETGILAVLRPWAESHGLDATDADLLASFAGHEARAEAEFPGDPYPSILARSMRGVGADLGVAVSAAEAGQLATSVPDWPAFPDSAEALSRLAERYRLVILSNVDRESFAGSNRRLGVAFTSIITAEDVGSYKPSLRNFEALEDEVRRLGVPPDRHLHAAQSLFHDHVPAKAMGLRTVWINRTKSGWGATPRPDVDVDPDWVFPTMAAFADAVDADADR